MPTSDKMISSSFQLLWGLLILSIPSSASLSQVHIVYLGHNHGNQQKLTTEFHIKLLSKVFSSEDEAKETMLYSYWHSFSGFAASLNSTQATNMAKMEEVISIFRSKTLKLHTTRSWDFMGLPLFNTEAATMQSKYGDDVVIGIFDTAAKLSV